MDKTGVDVILEYASDCCRDKDRIVEDQSKQVSTRKLGSRPLL
jgi:hypothetical protein